MVAVTAGARTSHAAGAAIVTAGTSAAVLRTTSAIVHASRGAARTVARRVAVIHGAASARFTIIVVASAYGCRFIVAVRRGATAIHASIICT